MIFLWFPIRISWKFWHWFDIWSSIYKTKHWIFLIFVLSCSALNSSKNGVSFSPLSIWFVNKITKHLKRIFIPLFSVQGLIFSQQKSFRKKRDTFLQLLMWSFRGFYCFQVKLLSFVNGTQNVDTDPPKICLENFYLQFFEFLSAFIILSRGLLSIICCEK